MTAEYRHYRGLPSRVYVASSWRCTMQQSVVHTLRAAGIDCYDFRNPRPGDNGFHWSEVMPSYNHESCDQDDYRPHTFRTARMAGGAGLSD